MSGHPQTQFSFFEIISFCLTVPFPLPSWFFFATSVMVLFGVLLLCCPFCGGSSMPSVFAKELPSSLPSGVLVNEVANPFLSLQNVPFLFRSLFLPSPGVCFWAPSQHLKLYVRFHPGPFLGPVLTLTFSYSVSVWLSLLPSCPSFLFRFPSLCPALLVVGASPPLSCSLVFLSPQSQVHSFLLGPLYLDVWFVCCFCFFPPTQ